MPEINFVLPHWLYWSGLLFFPLIAMWLFHRHAPRSGRAVSLPLAYFLLLSGGFVGVHRMYLKSRWSLIFIVLFIAILAVNQELRETRNVLSNANNRIMVTEFELEQAREAREKEPSPQSEQELETARQNLADARDNLVDVQQHSENWHLIAGWLGGAVIFFLLV
ncbi:MAG: hypothetical protein SV201_10985, partial [Pseudomonadota bacterium]|nr:hypothetical protein [Pseudomonadota bacterium]